MDCRRRGPGRSGISSLSQGGLRDSDYHGARQSGVASRRQAGLFTEALTGKPLRNRESPSRSNLTPRTHAGRGLGRPAGSSSSHHGRQRWGWQCSGFPSTNELPQHGSSPKEEGGERMDVTMANYEEVTDSDVTDRV